MNKFFKDLNQSIPFNHTFKAWSDYRNQVTDLILSYINQQDHVLIIGAGNGLDLDYNRIKSYQITLLDVDETAIHKGMAFQNVTLNYLIKDITGLDALFYKRLEKTPGDYEQIIHDYTLKYVLDLEKQYDKIIILPIYTQLLIPIFQVNPKADISKLMTFVGQRIQLFHQKMQSILNTKGQLIVFSDILEYNFKEKDALIILDQQNNQAFLKDHVYSYIRGYGHGLGTYGLYDLREDMTSIYEYYLLWPFSKERLLLVQHEVFEQKEES